MWKRALDLSLGGLALVALAPLMVVLGVLIRFDSPGPVFFRQERVGQNGRRFRIWKFRSMRAASDESIHREAAQVWFQGQAPGTGRKNLDDPRVTRMGRWLRRSSLDELPQLFNVIRGEMSLVGPRPAIPYELELYEPWYFERQRAKPGMTGLWQVSGRDDLPAPVMMQLDIRYARNCSILLDLSILAGTLPALFGRRAPGLRPERLELRA